MKFIGLISGGKDSIYTICKLKDQGHELVALVYMKDLSQTIDSYMYQSVGNEVINLYSECFGLNIHIYETHSKCINDNLNYEITINDEVEDLYNAILDMKNKYEFEAVSSGAILSNYQKNRVENICERLKLVSLAPLWESNQEELLNEMINYGIEARIVKVASPGFDKSCIGYNLKEIYEKIESMKCPNKSFYFNYCGEGGEYETIVCYAPGFRKRIFIEEYDVLRHPEEGEKEWNVFFMKIKSFYLLEV